MKSYIQIKLLVVNLIMRILLSLIKESMYCGCYLLADIGVSVKISVFRSPEPNNVLQIVSVVMYLVLGVVVLPFGALFQNLGFRCKRSKLDEYFITKVNEIGSEGVAG